MGSLRDKVTGFTGQRIETSRPAPSARAGALACGSSVIDVLNHFFSACSGTLATKHEPWLMRLVMVNFPRCRVRMCLAMARPRPVPFFARLWTASMR